MNCISNNQIEAGSSASKSIRDLSSMISPFSLSSSSSSSDALETLRQHKLIKESEDDEEEKPRLDTANSANLVRQVWLKTRETINNQLGLNEEDGGDEESDGKLKPAQRWKKLEERIQALRVQKQKVNASWEIQCQ